MPAPERAATARIRDCALAVNPIGLFYRGGDHHRLVWVADPCDASVPLLRSQHHNKRAHLHPIVEIDHILIGQPDAARRNRMSDPLWLVRAMDAIQRILAAGVKVHRARTHRIVRTAFDIVRKRAEPALLTLGRRPSRHSSLRATVATPDQA